jgi:hypothetical protein
MKRSQVSLGAGSVTMPAMEAALTTEFMTTSRGIRPGKYNANKKNLKRQPSTDAFLNSGELFSQKHQPT